MKLKRLAAALVFLASIPSAFGVEVPYMPGSGWKAFTFRNPSGSARMNEEGQFSFTVYPGQNAVLTVVDGGWNVEKFEIFNNGSWAGWTTSDHGPGQSGQYYSAHFHGDEGAGLWSGGSWALAPGTYKLSFQLLSWSSVKFDEVANPIYRGGFKVAIVQTPDADGDKIADQFETGTGIYVSPVNTGTNPAVADSDGDGIGDWTEISVHSTNPNQSDSDGDGFLDPAEIHAGKSPTDPLSFPAAALAIRQAIEVTLYTQAGVNYQVEWSEDLDTWTPLPEIIEGDGNPVTRFYSTRENGRRFYRPVKLAAE
jgi:hypothetical protein